MAARVDREGNRGPGRQRDALADDVDGDPQVVRRRGGGEQAVLVLRKLDRQQAILEAFSRKMSLKPSAMTQRMPNRSSAQTAFSRELPQPKFAPASRIARGGNARR